MAQETKAWAKIVAKAWSDPAFKQTLLNNPHEVCKQFGVQIPSGCSIHVHENTSREIHLTLPMKPSGELSEEKLQEIAAGALSNVDIGPFQPTSPAGG